MICPKCQRDKPFSEYYISQPKIGKPQSYCKACHNKYCADRLTKRKIKAVKLLGGVCQDCGEFYHYSVYDFHHLSGKDHNWMSLRRRKWSDVERELEKCILLCANCHRVRHHS